MRIVDVERHVTPMIPFSVQQGRITFHHPLRGDGRIFVRPPRFAPAVGRDGRDAVFGHRAALVRVGSGLEFGEGRGDVCALKGSGEVVFE